MYGVAYVNLSRMVQLYLIVEKVRSNIILRPLANCIPRPLQTCIIRAF